MKGKNSVITLIVLIIDHIHPYPTLIGYISELIQLNAFYSYFSKDITHSFLTFSQPHCPHHRGIPFLQAQLKVSP